MTTSEERVVWHEGQFLEPQHLQQQERWFESLLQLKTEPLRVYPWGLRSLELDEELLQKGTVSLVGASGIFPDGTPFRMPDRDPAPPVIHVQDAVQNQTIVLAAPLTASGAPVFELEAGQAPQARFGVERRNLRDRNSGDRLETSIHLGRLRTRLMLERDAKSGYTSIGIARIRRSTSGGAVVLDDDYVPPCLDVRAARRLLRWLATLDTALTERGDDLAYRVGSPSLGEVTRFGNYLFLLMINQVEPVVRHLHGLAGLHPEELYRSLLAIVGVVSTFTESRRTPTFPAYAHDDLATTFEPLFRILFDALEKKPPNLAIRIVLLDRRHGYRLALLDDDDGCLARGDRFVVVVKADMDGEELSRAFPNGVKVGPVDGIKRIVQLNLPGIRLRPIRAPRELRPDDAAVYFQLDHASPLWRDISEDNPLVFKVIGNFNALRLECWAIRSAV